MRQVINHFASGPLCKCGCGERTSRGGKRTRGTSPAWAPYRKYVSGHRPPPREKLPDELGAKHKFLIQCRWNAKKRGIEFSLSDEEAIKLISLNCHYCGQEPSPCVYTYSKEKVAKHFNRNGIDRVDNSVGYVSGNVVACCATCNHAKKAHSAEEFLAWARRVVNHNV